MTPAKNEHIALGAWAYAIKARPRLTLKESVGKNGTIVIAHWYDPHARGGKTSAECSSRRSTVRPPRAGRQGGAEDEVDRYLHPLSGRLTGWAGQSLARAGGHQARAAVAC